MGSVAKIGTREDGTINIIASDPSFTPLIKNAIMINVHGLNPINESDVVLIINSKRFISYSSNIIIIHLTPIFIPYTQPRPQLQ